MKKKTPPNSLPLFEGKNTELIYLRVPKTLLETLEEAAQKAGQPLPTYIRDLLSFHFMSEVLKEKIEKGLLPDREDKVLLESGSFKEYFSRLEEIARLVKKFRKTTTEMSKQSDSLTLLVEEKLAKVMDRVRKELKGGTK
jgi:predicted DNA binding CopG/RHH family protein